MKYFLEGEKVGLKKLSIDEVTQDYVDWMNDFEVTKYMVSGKFPSDMDDIKEYVRKVNGPNSIAFAIYRKDKKKHVGNVKLDKIDWISRKAEFGIMIGDKSSWGIGIGTEATKLVLEYAFNTLNLEKVNLGVLKENVNAYKIYSKLGFVEEGVRKNEQFTAGKYHDSVIMGITKKRWKAHNCRVGTIIQVRTSSTRLPNKAFLPLRNVPSFLMVYERVKKASLSGEIVIATSKDKSDDDIERICVENNINVFRGSLHDVLERYYEAAKFHHFDVVIRITADCPLIDPYVIDKAVEKFMENIGEIEYVSNVDERTFPDGFDVEVFTFDALERAYLNAKDPYDREHVTPYIRRNSKKLTVFQDVDLSDLRLTLDYEEDYKLIKDIYESIRKDFIETKDIYDYLVKNEDKILVSQRILDYSEKTKIKYKLIEAMKRILK